MRIALRDFLSFSAGSRGATYLEFSLVAGLLLAMFAGLLDGSRIITAKAGLNDAAERALNMAKKEPALRVDLRTLDLSRPEDQKIYNDFLAARSRILTLAQNQAAKFVGGIQKSPGASGLLPVTHFDHLSTSTNPVEGFAAALLLPGDSVKIGSGSSSVWLDHKDICSPDSDTCPKTSQLSPSDRLNDLLANYPIEIHLRARVKTFFGGLVPYFKSITVEADSFGWSEGSISKLFPADIVKPPTSAPGNNKDDPCDQEDIPRSDAECAASKGAGYCYNNVFCLCVPCGGA
ncbi:MAG: pilus assembly protein [Candidatus Dadabacteria bacterium]|nr:MAG: pilus assembly protein [Candidatus Dadabacteria bacterium]